MLHAARQLPAWLIFDVGQKRAMPSYLIAMMAISLIGVFYYLSTLRVATAPHSCDQYPVVYGYSPVWRIAILLVGVAFALAAFLLPPDDKLSRNQETLYRLLFLGIGVFAAGFSQFLHSTHRVTVYETYIVCRKFGGEEEIPFSDLSSATVAGTGLFIIRTSGRALSYAVGISRAGELVQRINAGIAESKRRVSQVRR